MARWLSVSSLVLALLSGACASDEPSTDGGGGTSALAGDVSCTADPRVDAFRKGMAKDGALGVLRFELLTSDPAPPAKGDNAFVLRVADASGASQEVSLAVELSMPDHGHGSPVAPKVGFDGESFSVAPLDLFMAGVWQIDFHATSSEADGEAPIDDVSWFFCIEG